MAAQQITFTTNTWMPNGDTTYAGWWLRWDTEPVYLEPAVPGRMETGVRDRAKETAGDPPPRLRRGTPPSPG